MELSELSDHQKELVMQHLETANNIAREIHRKASHVLEIEDVTSMAYSGLVDAAARYPKYCLDKGYTEDSWEKFFFAYARHRIKGFVYDTIRKYDWATRGMRQKSKKLREAGQDQGASVKEMAESSGLSEKVVAETLFDMSIKTVSVEADEIDYSSRHQDTESSVLASFLLEVLVDAIKHLDPLSQVVLALHYYEEVEVQHIAKILGITEHRSSQLHTKSVLKIKSALVDAMAGRGLSFPLEG